MAYTVYFDTETGGVKDEHPTISLAAVAVGDGFVQVSSFSVRIAFSESDCDPAALALNHYTAEDWKSAVSPTVAAAQFAEWVRPYASIEMTSKRTGRPYRVAQLAGYNALTFDMPRLRRLFGDQFFPCAFTVLDVLQRVLFHFHDEPGSLNPPNYKLSTVAEHFGIDARGAHEALTDVRLTVSVHRRLVCGGD